ncbi:MAG TPA: phosphatidylglycerophosphatase A, partial [Burkholderiaceae bacterium]
MSDHAPRRATVRFMVEHPAHWIALGFGSGLAPRAPGTFGTLWGWAVFILINPFLADLGWALLFGLGTLLGWWACTLTARHMRTPDPGA